MKAALAAFAAVAALAAVPAVAAPPSPVASFASSDPLLNRIWADSVRTARDMLAPGPLVTDSAGRPCPIALPTVILDGAVRDRCPYVGDLAVSGLTLLLSTPSAAPTLRGMVLWFAENQHADGSIPASPAGNGQVFFDYNAYWVEDLYDDVLYTGDLALARQVWPVLVKLMDGWYPAQAAPGGLLVNDLGRFDYAFIPRTGTTVAYYNAGYALALELGSKVAGWLGETAEANAWTARLGPLGTAFRAAFWDAKAGAFRDATAGAVVHPEDGNAFAILGGLATVRQGRSALDYLTYHDSQPYGSTIADDDVWDGYPWGDQASQRAYPFISYFEVLARYAVGFDASALDLIRREWGDMAGDSPSATMWETIGAGGSAPVGGSPSWDHGWSSGAAPALTDEVLGVTPATPGFGTFRAAPHPSGLTSAAGLVPTPHGAISFAWRRAGKAIAATVTSPVPGTIVLPLGGEATLDGNPVPSQHTSTTVSVPAGSHRLVVSG
jgi:hypothetical protein